MTANKPPRRPTDPPSLGTYRPSVEADPRTAGRPAPAASQPNFSQPPPSYRPPPPGYGPPGGRMPPPSAPYRPGPPDKEGGGVLKWLVVVVVVVGALLAAGAAALYIAGPADLVRDQIIARVKQQTGRDLVITGPTSFTFYPSLGVSMSDVSLSAPPGMSSPPLVTVKKLTASVDLMPLLKRDVQVKEVRLDEPVFNLEIDKAGNRSWQFTLETRSTHPLRYAQAAPPGITSDAPAALPSAGPAAKIENLSLADLRITGGTLLYADQRNNSLETVSDIDVKVTAPALASTATLDGSLRWRNEPLDVTSEITSPATLMDTSAARIITRVKGRPLDLRYEGSVRFAGAADLDGNLALSAPSLRGLAAFARSKDPTPGASDPLAVTGRLSTSGNTWTLSGATAAIERTKGTGDIAVTTGGARPVIRANLKFAELDLNAILGLNEAGSSETGPPSASSPPAKKPAAPAGGATPQSIEDLLKANPAAPGTAVRGYTKRDGWSEDPYDFTILALADADARVGVGRLLYKDIKIGQSNVNVGLKAGVLKIDLSDVQLYGGRGKGLVAIDASDMAYPRITTNIALDGVEGLPLLKDAADLDWLAGKAKITAGVTGQGKNQAAIMNSLGGSADISFTDGAIVGINIPGLLRNLGQGKLGGLSSSPSEKTDFSEMTSSWAINNGVARNNDLKLVGPLLRLTGEGAVKLGERSLDYTLKPKIVADARGQGGPIDIGGLEVPVKVSGPWAKPKFAPDVGGVLKDPDKAVETIKEIGKQFKGKDAKEILRGILGGGGAPPQ